MNITIKTKGRLTRCMKSSVTREAIRDIGETKTSSIVTEGNGSIARSAKMNGCFFWDGAMIGAERGYSIHT